MNSEEERRRPYAAPSNIVSVLQRVRTRNLPERIDNDFLRIAGVPENVFSRVAFALRFLGFVDEGNRPTDTLRALSAAPDEEYRSLLAGALREAYKDDFEKIDPAQDSQARIVDAFRRYEPRSQTNRMVMLFLAMCREAGLPVLDAPRERSMRDSAGRPRKAAPQRRPAARPRGAGPTPDGHQGAPSLPASGMLFGVTESDIGELDEDEFAEVWAALGKVARARARARGAQRPPEAREDLDQPEDDEGL